MIRKLSILFAVLISAALSKKYWECDREGKMKCPQNNTCCRSKTSVYGWACFPLIEAVCCSDGVNVCPYGTICDLTAKTCRRATLAFLELPETQAGNHTNPIFSLKPIDALNFALGFYQGVEILNPVLGNSTCIHQSERVVSNVNHLIDVLSHLKIEYLAADIKEILHVLEDLVNIGETQIPVCKKLGLDLEDLFVRVYQHVGNAKYIEKIGSHTIFNLGKIKEIYEGAIKDVQAGNFFGAGRGFGQLLKFATLWDF